MIKEVGLLEKNMEYTYIQMYRVIVMIGQSSRIHVHNKYSLIFALEITFVQPSPENQKKKQKKKNSLSLKHSF